MDKLTNEELNEIKSYQNETYIIINRLLNEQVENDIEFLSQNKNLEFSKEILVESIEKFKNISEAVYNNQSEVLGNEDNLKIYKIGSNEKNLKELSSEENSELYESILSRVDEAFEKLKNCIDLDNEIAVNYENIRKLEQLLAKHTFAMEQENYEKDTTDAEKQSDLEDVARINSELTSLKNQTANKFYARQENCNMIQEWKEDVAVYLKDEVRKIEKKSKEIVVEKKEEENLSEEKKEIISSEERQEILENIAVIGTLIKNIKDLISRQQNHARIAEAVDSNYKALNNAFEMKNYAEELDSLMKAVLNKFDISEEEEKEKISKVNIQVSVLLNYLNNAKAGVGKNINRFDEMNIIEENELKREIAETIKNIRCEAELKKLRDDIDIIEDKNVFKKFIGRFTGRNKLDETMLEQIDIRQKAVKKRFKTKMPLSYNYSIHKLIAEIEMFIDENKEDDLVTEDVSSLRKIKDNLKKNFVIIDSKVASIIERKTGKNLPLASQKLSKKEIIEIDTYRFLNKYGYDKTNDVGEPDYQDTMPSEIKRIIDYIKTSDIL